jgi:D-alanine-D-alanine ligase
MEIPYSGSGPIAESGGYNKYMIKKQLQSADILTPNCQLFYTPYDKLSASISFPVIVKLNETHGSVDLDEHAICHNSHSLQKRLSYLYKRYQQTMLVEEFIMGDEFSAIVIDSKNKLQTFVAKNIFPNKDPYTFASFNLQWTNEEVGFEKYCDPDLTVLLKKAYRVVGMRDYGKFDLRKDKKGRYYFLDSNTNPAFGPLENDCAISSVLHLYGVSFENLLLKVFQNMMERKIKIK